MFKSHSDVEEETYDNLYIDEEKAHGWSLGWTQFSNWGLSHWG